jgi:hypothetical protein
MNTRFVVSFPDNVGIMLREKLTSCRERYYQAEYQFERRPSHSAEFPTGPTEDLVMGDHGTMRLCRFEDFCGRPHTQEWNLLITHESVLAVLLPHDICLRLGEQVHQGGPSWCRHHNDSHRGVPSTSEPSLL